MSNWKSCNNCGGAYDCKAKQYKEPTFDICIFWRPLHCPYCNGVLSKIRTFHYDGGPISELAKYDGKKYRHCYGCHAEFFEEVEDETVQHQDS